MNNQIRKHFDQSVNTYQKAAVIQKKVAVRCCSHIPENDYSRVLEIGAGGGLFTEYFFRRKSNFGIYVALDVSRMMLKLIPAGRIVLMQADGERAPFKRESFDLLVSSSAMQWYQGGVSSIIGNISLLKKRGFFSLAVFVEGTFVQLGHVSSLTGFGSLYPLPPAGVLVDSLCLTGQRLEWEIEDYKAYFPSVQAFLKNHKHTGANYSRPGAGFGRKAYNDFCRKYEEIYGEKKGIPANYKVLYLWGNKS